MHHHCDKESADAHACVNKTTGLVTPVTPHLLLPC